MTGRLSFHFDFNCKADAFHFRATPPGIVMWGMVLSGHDEMLTRRRLVVRRVMEASSKSRGSVSATFGVPGLMGVPRDGAVYCVPIALLELGVCAPRRDCRVHAYMCVVGRCD